MIVFGFGLGLKFKMIDHFSEWFLYMFVENDSSAIKSSAIDSAWTEVRSKFLFCAKSHPNHEIRSFQSGGSEIP